MDKSIHTREYALFLELLRRTREQAGLTQIAVAERLDVAQSFISKCERGERRLDIVELRQWCRAIDTTVEAQTKALRVPELENALADARAATENTRAELTIKAAEVGKLNGEVETLRTQVRELMAALKK